MDQPLPPPPPPPGPSGPPGLPGTPGPSAGAIGPVLATVPGPAGTGLGQHVRRALQWRIPDVQPSPAELAALVRAGVHQPPVQRYLAWRRSALAAALPMLALAAVLSLVATLDVDTSGLTSLGSVLNYLPTLALWLVPIGSLVCIKGWTDLRRTTRILQACWAASVAVPILVALVPVDWWIDLAALRAQTDFELGEGSGQAVVQGLRVLFALNYAVVLLPTIVSVPGGALRGALRAKGMIPASDLPGWFLVAIAPFYSLFAVAVFVLIDQVLGNLVLIAGVGLVAASPWVFVARRRDLMLPTYTPEGEAALVRARTLSAVLMYSGFLLVVAYALTGRIDGQKIIGSSDEAVFGFTEVGRTVAEVASRSLVATVVFTQVFMGMTLSHWRHGRAAPAEARARLDDALGAFQAHSEA